MCKCFKCVFNNSEFDGELISRYDGSLEGNGEWIGTCSKGQLHYYEKSSINCNKYKEITVHCRNCKELTTISQLHQGFCSIECKNTYIEHIKKSIINDKAQFTVLQGKIVKLNFAKSTYTDELEVVSLQENLQNIEHYIESGKDILKSLKVDFTYD